MADQLLGVATTTWELLLGGALHLTLFLLVALDILRRRREPTAATAWLLFTWFLPFAGALLYLMIGHNRLPRKALRKQERDRALVAERRAREEADLEMAYWRAVRETRACEPPTAAGATLNRALDGIVEDFPLLGGNAIRLLVDGDEAYGPMLAAIEAAEQHIHLQSFILGADATGRRFMDALAARARAGVTVRVLYDRFGSTGAVLRRFFHRYRGIPNLEIAGWTQSNLLKRQFAINLRNHRKLLVVDGLRAFTGGLNLHDGHLSHGARLAIRDYHFEVRGPVVQELQFAFLQDWHFITDEPAERFLRQDCFPHQPVAGGARIRALHGAPVAGDDVLGELFFQAILAARQRLWAATPYFAPPPDLLHALRAAARRGVEVRLILPRVNNHLYAGYAGRAHYEELLAAGVRIFERLPPFFHAKALIADDTVALVGTANLDMRSLRLNYESVLAVYDVAFIASLAAALVQEQAHSQEVALAAWRRRPLFQQVAENACHLFTPIL
ncbi:MAG: cardiolipin synthase [Lentisphaeria bacterium]|jgi:cardiolipin synthase